MSQTRDDPREVRISEETVGGGYLKRADAEVPDVERLVAPDDGPAAAD